MVLLPKKSIWLSALFFSFAITWFNVLRGNGSEAYLRFFYHFANIKSTIYINTFQTLKQNLESVFNDYRVEKKLDFFLICVNQMMRKRDFDFQE